MQIFHKGRATGERKVAKRYRRTRAEGLHFGDTLRELAI